MAPIPENFTHNLSQSIINHSCIQGGTFIHSLQKYLLRTYFLSNAVLGIVSSAPNLKELTI